MSKINARTRRMLQHIANLGNPDAKIAERAEAILARYYGSAALEFLISACADPNPGARFRIVRLLGNTKDPRAFEPILRLTQDPDDGVRFDAVISLGILSDERAIPALIPLLRIQEAGMDVAAGIALEQFGKRAVPSLLPLLHDADPDVRIKPAYVLGNIGDETAIEPLVELLSYSDEWSRIAGVEALAEIGTPRCLELIGSCLSDPSDSVRRTAVYWQKELLHQPRAASPKLHSG